MFFLLKNLLRRGIRSPSNGLCDPFVICKVTNRGLTPDIIETIKGQKSKIVKKTANPLWNDIFYFPVMNQDSEQVHISVWNWYLMI